MFTDIKEVRIKVVKEGVTIMLLQTENTSKENCEERTK